MKILFVGDFFPGSLEVSYFNAFIKAGCNAIQFDYMVEYKTLNPLAGNRYANRLLRSFYNIILNKTLLSNVELTKPDLVFIVKGGFIFPRTLKKIKENDNRILLFNFNPDNPFDKNIAASNSLIRESISLYDCYFIWGKFLIPELIKAGAKRVEYLPFAYDPDLHYPIDVSQEEKKIFGSEVVFIGTWDKERESFLEGLLGYDLGIWGNSWEKLRIGSPLRAKLKASGNLGKDISKVANASKICLNFIRKQMGDAHNLRTFEIPACKGFMLTTRSKEQCEFFEEGKDIACFDTLQELRIKLEQFLSNNNLREEYRFNAHIKVKPYTCHERIKKILEVYELIRSK